MNGQLKGLKSSELKRLEKLFNRRFDREELVPPELGREIFSIGDDLGRRVGVLVSREGRVEEVVVGTREILYLPDLGRYRLGRGRLRRLKLIFSDLSKNHDQVHIPADHYADLEKLRLDMVIGVRTRNRLTSMAYAYLRPLGNAEGEATHTEQVRDLGGFELDYATFMEELEDELSQTQGAAVATQHDGTVLVGVYDKRFPGFESSMAELKELARTAGVKVIDTVIQRRDLDPRTLLGKGKLEEVVLRCLRLGAEILIFDCELKPGQWRQITNQTELKVLDRSMLILDIFAQRAKSSEGRLQVELAQLKYNLPRLVEQDTGLSRLTGGIGGRGPGETKLEIGRRRIRDRIIDLERRIEELSQQRHLRRTRQRESRIPSVAVLGYTNVGKSTLFNALSKSQVLAEDKLFATLDPAQRRVVIPAKITGSGADLPFVISDTVGFIRDLPVELKTAFRATLEELNQADLLVHVLDASDPELMERKAAVDAVLGELQLGDIPQILVVNKIDLILPERAADLSAALEAVPVSAQKREGLERLLAAIAGKLLQLADPAVGAAR
ncbi:MAG: GTPase HflX [Oligoflexia bacterium]|nr:GTPase HflX [Oligoflexia bacterium]